MGWEKKFELFEFGCGVGVYVVEILCVSGVVCLKRYYLMDVCDYDGLFVVVMENCVDAGASGMCAASRTMDAMMMVDVVEVELLDGVLMVNVVYILSCVVMLGMFVGSVKVLRKGGLVFVYGSFKVGGEFRFEGDVWFDVLL